MPHFYHLLSLCHLYSIYILSLSLFLEACERLLCPPNKYTSTPPPPFSSSLSPRLDQNLKPSTALQSINCAASIVAYSSGTDISISHLPLSRGFTCITSISEVFAPGEYEEADECLDAEVNGRWGIDCLVKYTVPYTHRGDVMRTLPIPSPLAITQHEHSLK